MMGFKIWINDAEVICAAAEQVLTVFIEPDGSYSPYTLVVTGADERSDLKWNDRPLKKGDRIRIKVEDMDQINLPDQIKPMDMQTLKEWYNTLKKELIEKGLLP